ncbi:phage antirepressor KilAC domain-containing protein [Cryobacterium sp. PH31-O1]|uniref:phage antirepressor KilAC domain-containing protein n=1 Tax=Cryobacterium sp. PH31-O1 TaxID=3046306 RepID=UPI0024BACB6A|nr:phage antirepressor KilAC domain-containing protein [Cryobacterium sp. PH31-O1]MDJ0337418.1 phage antirepressor KilAC domain-containing protein [Cryobacterium sp. PH31-O1]
MSATIATAYAERLDDLKVITLTDGEVWSARDLMEFAGYTEWRNWSKAIDRAVVSVNTTGISAADHFVGVNKMVQIGSGSRRQVEDVEVTRYGAYILFQNADPSKPAIAAVQQYFAVQTRRQEVAEPAALPGDYLAALKALVAEVESTTALKAQAAIDAPKVAYVDEFLASEDVVLFRAAASELGVAEGVLRETLLDANWIYRLTIGKRWSNSRQKDVPEVEYRAASAHGSKFRLMPQHNAPRHHNGQVKQTLYIRSESLPAIRHRFFTAKAVAA